LPVSNAWAKAQAYLRSTARWLINRFLKPISHTR
jgi:hypothetical protein